jgi:hypothetical protein
MERDSQMDKVRRKGFWLRLLCAGLVVLVAFQVVNSDSKDPNDLNEPNEPTDPNIPDDPNDPEELLRYKWDAVVSILQNKDIDQEDKEKRISKIVTPIFD